MEKNIKFDTVGEFDFFIKHAKIDGYARTNVHYPHIHNHCEIYINVSGDVSFMVENKLYPISAGSVLITRPNEFHHCIYNDMDLLHEHYCIFLSVPEESGLMDRFFKRKNGQDNLIIFNPMDFEKIKGLCDELLNETDRLKLYRDFIELIYSLSQNEKSDGVDYTRVPRDVTKAIEYIYKHFEESVTVGEIAEVCNVSVNTLERHFKEYVNMTPYGFLKFKRMAVAVEQLQKGSSVQEAADKAGFADCSKFITEFKKIYKKTPLKFKQQKAQ